jgi:hypothetical protein
MKERNFVDPVTGDNSSLPWSPDDALTNGYTRWMDRDGCPRCKSEGRGDGKKARYLKDNGCTFCLTIDAHTLWPQWLQGDPGRPEPWSTHPDTSVKKGLTWYYGSPSHDVLCTHGPHLRKTSIATGRCLDCEEGAKYFKALTRGPRAAARAAGERTYVPVEICPSCGLIAPRNVMTDACSGCKTRRDDDGRRTPSQIFAEQFPDFIIDRESARGLGFTLFRTGEPCRRGHTGWRYVSTGNCLKCLRGSDSV